MAQNNLKKKLEDTQFDEMVRLQEITDEMFTRFVNADVELAGEKAKNVVLMQEIQRLEQENGNLRTELVDTEERYWKVHEEVDKAKKSLCDLVGQIAALVEENRKMKRELAEFSGGQGSGRPTDATNVCECPKCGSIDAKDTPTLNEVICAVCGTRYEVDADG